MTSIDPGWEAAVTDLSVTGAELAVLLSAIRETRESLDDDREFGTRVGATPAAARALADRLRGQLHRLQDHVLHESHEGGSVRSANVEIGTYSRERGLQLVWVDGSRIDVAVRDGAVLVRADAGGLRSLAAHLLTLADVEVPVAAHVHLEPGVDLEDESMSLVMERTDF